MKVADLTVEELQELIRATIEDVLGEYAIDSDGAVKADVAARLRASLDSGNRGIPLEEAAKALGLDW